MRVHKADWKVDTLIRTAVGTVIDHIKETGVYARYDTSWELDKNTKEKLNAIVYKPIDKNFSQICDKIALILPESKEVSVGDVRIDVGRDLNVSPKDVQVNLKEQNVALIWKFTLSEVVQTIVPILPLPMA